MSEFQGPNKDRIIETVKKIGDFMNMECQVEVKEETFQGGLGQVPQQGSEQADSNRNVVAVSIYVPENARFLIGKNGENLKALEHILRAMLLRNDKEIASLSVDVNDYRKAKSSEVINLAREAAVRVRNTKKAEALYPMSAYERRLVHAELASHPDVSTESIGDEPQRRVVIKPLNF